MSDLFSRDDLGEVVGVIDLLDGAAVHAVAGNRASYRPVAFCDGNPVALARHYLDAGVTALYIADLDALASRAMQSRTIESICRAAVGHDVYVDIGWSGSESSQSSQAVFKLGDLRPNVHWIAATESCRSTEALEQLAQLVSANRMMLGLDYRHGDIIDHGVGETAWLQAADAIGLRGVVILDLASVGSGVGPATAEICRRVKRHSPQLQVFSGGGIRDASDVEQLRGNGCDRFLVATALLAGSAQSLFRPT